MGGREGRKVTYSAQDRGHDSEYDRISQSFSPPGKHLCENLNVVLTYGNEHRCHYVSDTLWLHGASSIRDSELWPALES